MRNPGTDPTRSWTQLTLVCGFLAAAVGVLALVGWVLGSESLTALEGGRIPMAPSTAVLFVVLGALTALDGIDRPILGHGTHVFAAAVATALSAVLLILSTAGLRPGIEHLGMEIAGEVAGAPIGHMSPLTALAFLIAGSAYLLHKVTLDAWRDRAAFGLAIAVELIAIVLLTAYLLSRPILYDTGMIPPALNTSLGFALLGGALLGVSARRVWAEPSERELSPRPVYGLLAVLAVAAAVIIVPAYLIFRDYERNFRAEVESQLLAVADLKVDQIRAWREERIRDANAFYASRTFGEQVEDALYGDDVEARAEIREWLSRIRDTFGYLRIAVADSTGSSRLVVPDLGEPIETTHSREETRAVIRSGRVAFLGFHRDSPDGVVHLTVISPILRRDGRVGAGLVIRVDPDTYLYPTLKRWPTPSRTAETLLVRRDEDDVLFLNDLRFRPDAALSLRIPVSDPDLPAARAVLGEEGIVEGVDYRGEPVVAAVRAVPDSDWRIVARMDVDEAYGPLQTRLAWTIAVVAFLLVAVIGGLGFSWQRREKLHYRRVARTEQRHRTLLRSIGDAVIATDSEGRVELMNPVAELLTGWTEDEAVGRPLEEVFRIVNEETREPVASPAGKVLRTGRIVGLANSTVLIARDGTERPIADSGAPVLGDGGGIAGVILVFRDQTRERKARRVLAAREERYRSLFNSIRDAILVANTDRRIIDCNPAFTELFGYEPADILGEPTVAVYESEAEYERVGERIRTNLGDPSFIQTIRYRKKNGEVFPGETNTFYLRDSEGETIGFIGLIRNVTERLEARRALEASEERYRTLYEAAPVGIFRTRSDGKALTVNRTMARILGFETVDEAIEHYTDLGHQLYARAERRQEFLDRLREQGSVSGFRYEAQRPDGETIWIEMDARMAAGDPGGVFEIEGFAWDVTARKQAEDALREHQRMLERTERIARIGSWELDIESGEVQWSDELFHIFGRDPAEGAPALGENEDLFVPEDLERLRTVIQRAITEAEPYDLEVRAIRSDGEIRHCRALGYPEQDPNGRVVTLYGAFADITERRSREEREAELRAQLAQAQKMEAVGRLAGGVAHDFNNMLSVILGHAELAMGALEPDHDILTDLEKIQQAAESSADLTRQLLAFAREQVAQPETLDLNDVVGSMLKMLRRLIGEDIELVWEPADDVWPVRVDPVQVDQILANLLVNARDAIEGVGQITIRTDSVTVGPDYVEQEPDAEPGDYVVLSVADTGRGIDPDVRERIFEPFFTTKVSGEGTGLGLATVYGIVRQNEGFITVYSEPGMGTTFKVYLPRTEEGLEAGHSETAADAGAVAGDETVLVVEDQEAVLELVKRILGRLGYSILWADTPTAAIEIAGEHSGAIDLLITDVILPEMNGRDLADRLVSDNPGLATLFMSGYAEDVIAQRGVIETGVHFLEKPFTAAELAAKVREALDADG